MAECVIVAIPEARDDVWEFSSEKVPHLTMLYLGEVDPGELELITEFVEHATRGLNPFHLSVDERGVLGDDDADVIFFEKNPYELPELKEWRNTLLLNDTIKSAFLKSDQYPNWTPHVTLGYPETPAKTVEGKRPEDMYSVRFNKIAVWVGEYEGPEFKLEFGDTLGDIIPNDTIAHYGVLGMKWGVRRTRDQLARAAKKRGEVVPVKTKTTPGRKVRASGGKNVPPSEDAINKAIARQTVRKSSVDALSTKELQTLVSRMQLEQNYANLAKQQQSLGARLAGELFGKKPLRDTAFSKMGMGENAKLVGDALASATGTGKKKK